MDNALQDVRSQQKLEKLVIPSEVDPIKFLLFLNARVLS
jgi:hypothetical protein